MSIINRHCIAIANASRAAHIAALNAIKQLETHGQAVDLPPINQLDESSDGDSDSSVEFEVDVDFIEFYRKSMEYKLLKSCSIFQLFYSCASSKFNNFCRLL
jgi:hypothetical protein